MFWPIKRARRDHDTQCSRHDKGVNFTHEILLHDWKKVTGLPADHMSAWRPIGIDIRGEERGWIRKSGRKLGWWMGRVKSAK